MTLTSTPRLEGAHHITFRGLEFHHTDWQCPTTGVCGQNDGVTTNTSGTIFLLNTSDITIEDSTIAKVGGYGIWASDDARSTMVQRSTVTDTAIGGIRVDGNGAVVQNKIIDCVLSDGGRVFPQGVGVRIEGRIRSP